MKYDLEVPDQLDHIYNTAQVSQYGTHRKGHFGGIKYIGTIIDDFGCAGGFDRILTFFDRISSGQLKGSVEHVTLVVYYLAATVPFWAREFMCTMMPTFNEKLLAIFTSNQPGNPLNQPHTKGQVNILINNYRQMLTRYYVPRRHTRMVNYMNSMIGCSLLRLENLEKRIHGIKLIAD